jgi:DNA repair exonuclease SbcCD ATPase subunit
MFPGGRRQPLAGSTLASEDLAIMEELSRMRLVRWHDRKDGAQVYEVEHEALAEHWSRLVGWLAEAREDRWLAEELERDAAAYARDHDTERLWKKGRLAAVAEITGRGRVMLSPAATQFLQHAHRRERKGRLAMRVLTGLGLVVAIFGGRMMLVSHEYAQMATELQRTEGERQRLAHEIDEKTSEWLRTQDKNQDAIQELKKHLSERMMQIDAERGQFKRELEDAKTKLEEVAQQRDTARDQAATAQQGKERENREKNSCLNYLVKCDCIPTSQR